MANKQKKYSLMCAAFHALSILNITIQFGLITKFYTKSQRHEGEWESEQINELKIKREWKS